MRLFRRRAWFWALIAWCLAADLIGAAVTARAGVAAVMVLATTLVALEAALAIDRRRRIVTLVTAFVMAIVFLVAAFAATAKPSGGIVLGGNPSVASFQLSGFQLQATSALAFAGRGVAILVVTLLLGLQLSRTNVVPALDDGKVSPQLSTPTWTKSASSPDSASSRTDRRGRTRSAEAASGTTTHMPAPTRSRPGAGAGRRRLTWRPPTNRPGIDPHEKTADQGELRPATPDEGADHPAPAFDAGPGSPRSGEQGPPAVEPLPLKPQAAADSRVSTRSHRPLNPSPASPGRPSPGQGTNEGGSELVEPDEEDAATTEERIVDVPDYSNSTPGGVSGGPSTDVVATGGTVQTSDLSAGEPAATQEPAKRPRARGPESGDAKPFARPDAAAGVEARAPESLPDQRPQGPPSGRESSAAGAEEVEHPTKPPAIPTVAHETDFAAAVAAAAEAAMRASLARLDSIREDTRFAGIRGAIDLEGLVCRVGMHGTIGPISDRIARGELVMVTSVGSTPHSEALLRVLHGDRPIWSGQAIVGGYNLRHVRLHTLRTLHRVVGFVEDLEEDLTPLAAFDLVLSDLGLVSTRAGWSMDRHTAALAAIDAVGLGSQLMTPLARMPKVEQRLIAFAAALVHSPSILLVDEPTANLKASGKLAVEALLRRLQAANLTVVVGTSDPRLLHRHLGPVLLI
jgi:putative ABC transport system ATP-binding protein